MSVALLTDADVFAGTERHILELAAALNRLPDAPAVSIACPVPSPLAAQAREAGIAVIAVPSSATGVLHWPTVRILRRLLKSGRVEILHAHNGRMALHAALAKATARRGTVVITQHFLAPSQAGRTGIKGKIFGMAHHWVNGRVAHFIAISRAVEQEMKNRGDAAAEDITTVLNALPDLDANSLQPATEVRSEFGLDKDTPLVVCVARLEKEKSVETLIAAMAILKREGVDARCLIAGQGDEKAALQSLIEREELASTVQLLGFREDVLSLIRAGDVFVLPSLAEPFGLVILEAMTLARPVVATNIGGPPEIIDNGTTGVLVSPGDARALAGALRVLLETPARREAMGRAGRARYETHFQPEQMAQSVREIYKNVLC